MSDDEKKLKANIAPFGLRMQPRLKAKIEAAAASNERSMNAEIVSRLERYDSLAGEVDTAVEIARALATEIDRLTDATLTATPLTDQIGDYLGEVGEDGSFDRIKIARHFAAQVQQTLQASSSQANSMPEHIRETVRIIGLFLMNAKFETSPIKSIVVLPDDAPRDLTTSGGPVPETFNSEEVLFLPHERNRVVPARRARK